MDSLDYELFLPFLLPKPGSRAAHDALLRLPDTAEGGRLGRDVVTSLACITTGKKDKVHRIGFSSFILRSVEAFIANLPAVVAFVTKHLEEEAEEEGAEVPAVLDVGLSFGEREVPSDKEIRQLLKLIYTDMGMTEQQVRDLHDSPHTRDKYELAVKVPWDEDHIRLFSFRDGLCHEVSSH